MARFSDEIFAIPHEKPTAFFKMALLYSLFFPRAHRVHNTLNTVRKKNQKRCLRYDAGGVHV